MGVENHLLDHRVRDREISGRQTGVGAPRGDAVRLEFADPEELSLHTLSDVDHPLVRLARFHRFRIRESGPYSST